MIIERGRQAHGGISFFSTVTSLVTWQVNWEACLSSKSLLLTISCLLASNFDSLSFQLFTMESAGCCRCCFSFIITLGLTALFLWLSLRTNEPKCYIGVFYVPALNETLKSPSNSSIDVLVELHNENKDKGVRYDNINFTVKIFLDRSNTSLIGNFTIDGFYQGHQKTAKKWSSFNAHDRVLNQTVDNKTYFRVDFRTAAKYKILFWFTKRDLLWGGANVEMNNSGQKAQKKNIRLGNSSPVIVSGTSKLDRCYFALVVLGLFVNFSLRGLLI